MKRWLIGILIVVVALGALLYVFRNEARFIVAAWWLTPSGRWHPGDMPAAPDYAEDAAWAALPEKSDGADRVPAGESDGQAAAAADVFFIHPTTYINGDSWNGPVDEPVAKRFLEEQVLVGQASAFNACCRIFAPRYRQATFAAFLDDTSGPMALEFAYKDVERAFDEFLKRIGDRPFIIAGHSQGAGHALTLLTQRITGTPLRARLIAAYTIGTAGMTRDAFENAAPDIPVCGDARQTGCVMNWISVGPKVAHWRDGSRDICVNPLTWTRDGERGDFALNEGSLSISVGMRLERAVADAECKNGELVVSEIRSDMYKDLPDFLGEDNYHLIDYGLFYINIRRNAVARVEAWMGGQSPE